MNIILIFTLCVGLTLYGNAEKYPPEEAADLFKNFITTYNKIYDDMEKDVRYKIFKYNLERINEISEKSKDTVLGITEFTDLTEEEFKIRHTGYINTNLTELCTLPTVPKSDRPVPAEFDWVSRGKVTPVKNQRNCSSSWAFSVIGNVESANAIKNDKLVSLSEQQLVDCDKNSFGCSGGLYTAFNYLQLKGSMNNDGYPYEAKNGKCEYNKEKVQVKVEGCSFIEGTEQNIVENLVHVGPLSIALDGAAVRFYESGIVTNDLCTGQAPNLAVLLVGYGTSPKGIKYWLIKNSWGEEWGEKGYFRIQRGVNCLSIMDVSPVTAVIA